FRPPKFSTALSHWTNDEILGGGAQGRSSLDPMPLSWSDSGFLHLLPDRLARSTRDLLNILDTTATAGAGFQSLPVARADTTTPHARLMLTVLGGLAEFERELILARTGDGRKRVKARGVRFGRPAKLSAHQRQEAAQRLAEGATQADLARSYGVSQAT